MAELHDKEQMIRDNLHDAGIKECSTCLSLYKEGRKEELLSSLNSYRHDLLESIHAEQSKLDCLDFLIYQLKKNK